jgi:hypothetical protein
LKGNEISLPKTNSIFGASMPTPFHRISYPSIEAQAKADEITVQVEVAMQEFAQKQYHDIFILEKYNQVHWNIQLNQTIFPRSNLHLFDVYLLEDPCRFKNTNGYYLMVTFWEVNHHDLQVKIPGNSKIMEFCILLHTNTQLPVRGWVGSKEVYDTGRIYTFDGR